MAAAAPSPEARHRAATLLLLLDDDIGDAAARKRTTTTKTSYTNSKKSTRNKVLHVALFSTLLLCATVITVHKTRRPYSNSLLPLPRDPTNPEAPIPISIAYAAELEIQWESIARSIAGAKRSVALLNFNTAEVARWRKLTPVVSVRVVRLRPADNAVTWDALYPEWIDEENAHARPRCPSLPDPRTPPGQRFDLVAIKLPCRGNGWSRDVARLHLQLAAAKIAVSAGSPEVLVVSECLPLPNLFPCKHLVHRDGDAWLYRPDAGYLRERIRLPVGSCELAVRLDHPNQCSDRVRREAYATVLHSSDAYVCGAIAAAQSIRQAGSARRDLVALVDYENISAEQRRGLAAAGWQVRRMERIRNPRAVPGAYNEWNYSKLRLWQQLTDYDKVVFVDADQLVLRDIGFLFAAAAPELSATGNSGALFNSGVMVLEPCNCTFQMLMSRVHDISSYNGGDQGYLNEVFTWWHRLPRRVNVLKYYRHRGQVAAAEAAPARMLSSLEGEEPYVVHYLGIKPWLCFRDYDCNWNVPWLRRFASDEAHGWWWAVHDRIAPGELAARFCALTARQKAALEHDRRQAEMANATDMHWRRAITDPRNRLPVAVAQSQSTSA